MGYEKKSVFYDTSSNSQIDENGLSTKLIGQYDIMNQDYKKGSLFMIKNKRCLVMLI